MPRQIRKNEKSLDDKAKTKRVIVEFPCEEDYNRAVSNGAKWAKKNCVQYTNAGWFRYAVLNCKG